AWVSTRQIMTAGSLAAAHEARAGRDGTAQLRRLVAVARTGSLSAAEDRMHAILRDAGISGWVANARVELRGQVVAVVDILFERARVVLQVDGWRAHRSREAFQRDRAQQNTLVAAGYVVL